MDNDGENEQIINGPYGGLYLDARDQKVYVFARGEGTSGMLSYTNYDNAVWVVHSDTSHMGRQMFWMTRYDGGEKIVEELLLAAEYWDSPDGVYDKIVILHLGKKRYQWKHTRHCEKNFLGGSLVYRKKGIENETCRSIAGASRFEP